MIKKIRENSFFIKNKKYFRFLSFCAVGAIAFIIDVSFFNLFYKIGISFVFSNTLSWFISMIFNFALNRNITFSARGSSIRKQMIKWLIVYAVAFLSRISLASAVLSYIGEENILAANIAFFAGLSISIPIAFFGSLFWVFRKKD